MTDLTIVGQIPETLNQSAIRTLVTAALESEGTEPSGVSISFVDEATIRDLNRRHRDINRPTDVLSYPFDASFPQGSGGEVIVCPSVIERLAAADGRDAVRAVKEAVVHGLLHLLGHEDETEQGADEMDRRTRGILKVTDG